MPQPPPHAARISELPAAPTDPAAIAELLGDRDPAVFLDYDGTLSEIVDDPARAELPRPTREAIERLAGLCPVAVISGRDLDDVRERVGLEGIWYAGSHGLDIAGPDGSREQVGAESTSALDRAERSLREELDGVPGVLVERKRFAIAIHYRRAAEAEVKRIEAAVARVAASEDGLRMTGGKKVFELRPTIEWDKGRALRHLIGTLGLDRERLVPLYAGDDVTDEDAFGEVGADGIALVVRGEDDARATLADRSLADPRALGEFLRGLASALRSREGAARG